MTIAAIIEPMTLLGSELREALSSHPGSYSEIRALTLDEESVGAVTEAGGRPALVQLADASALAGVDVIFDCGGGGSAEVLGPDLSQSSITILVDPVSVPESSIPVVAGVNLAAAMESNLVVSPDPATVLLTQVLAPLNDLDINRVVGHLLVPASARGQEGLDELFNQTRAILAMSPDRPEAVFGAQLAFNLLPIFGGVERTASQVSEILGKSIDIDIDATQAGVFHSLSASILVRVGREVNADEILERLLQSQYLEVNDTPESLGPVDAASSDRVLFSPPRMLQTREDSFRIWSVMDNLTRGGALNALAISEYILTHRN
jgi:aspartate-semialdehyde dehydrogenase